MQPRERITEQNGTQAVIQAAVDTLARGGERIESLAEVTHEARNMVAALGLYCDLLEAPGVLSAPYLHYGDELRLVATASRRLVQRLASLQGGGVAAEQNTAATPASGPTLLNPAAHARRTADKQWEILPAAPIRNMAAQLLATRNLLATMAGPAIRITMDAQDAEVPVRMTGEDLARVLINLVKNSIEAMPQGGHIHLSLREVPSRPGAVRWLTLTVEDNGPGIPDFALNRIFQQGFTTRARGFEAHDRSPQLRGLGLSITRSIVKAAGGRIHAANRDPSGACFQIGLPVKGR